METSIVTKNCQTLMKALRAGSFMCISESDQDFKNLQFNVNMIAAGTTNDLKKLERYASANGLNNDNYTIYHICKDGYAYQYNTY